ncbi:inositol hexakisphosphate and diphosphoinositol-pentakisphosphate kinase, partial [Elysia marginata]
VYTVGPDYQHAEARKSPALDGKVERDRDGKEIRYPVLLSNVEKMIARNVCKVFKQNVCGFDLLRASGKHFVCDVNGFSFVKTSSKYYDDCAKILGTLVMRACCPQLHLPYPMCTAPEDIPVVQTTLGSMMELRCVIAVIRHGDRTPKQKMKMEVKNKKFFDLFQKYGGYKTGHLKLKKPKQLQEVLDIVRHLLGSEGEGNMADTEVEEKKAKLNQLKLVLEMYGHFSGINRKVQLKYQPTGRPKRSSSEEGSQTITMASRQKLLAREIGMDLLMQKGSDDEDEFVMMHEDENRSEDKEEVIVGPGFIFQACILDDIEDTDGDESDKETPESRSTSMVDWLLNKDITSYLSSILGLRRALRMPYEYEFSGINRKVQFKYQPSGRPHGSSSEDDAPRDPSLVLILKWGGELTPAGRIQAENLGKAFRTLYPGGQGSNGQFEAPGLGFLRLHSTFRHDLKIYASDEGRVQMTAAAFTKVSCVISEMLLWT